jgi:DNA-directed RNA polymerase specialized sigma subunit
MGRRIKKEKYCIPVDGKYYETSEEVYRAYYNMENREKYQERLQKEHESSFEQLVDQGVQVEIYSKADLSSAEDKAVIALMIEKMLSKLALLNDYERWLIEEIYMHGKSEREIERDCGIPRKTISYQREKALRKLRLALEN